jgi:RNA polymerase sigma-70 factor, ECF subfamily
VVSDEKIVKKIQDGDKEKFGEIIEKYQGKLFGYIKNLINQNNMEVEDVVEDTLVLAYQNLNGFDTSKKFSSWIYRIAHNKAIDYFKKKRLKTTVLDDELEIGLKDGLFEELEIEKNDKKMVAKAVNSLEIKYKEVVVLYFFEDKSYEEISDILHLPVSNVGVLLYRAKDKLKILLKND